MNGGHTVPPFGIWLEENRNFLTKRLAGEAHADAAIDVLEKKEAFVGLMEHFDESLLLWRHWTELPDLEIRYSFVNRSTNNTTKENILANDENLERIREANQEDEKLYRHVLENTMENQRSRYGTMLKGDLKNFQHSLLKSTPPPGKNPAAKLKRNLIYRTGLRSPESDRRYT